MKRGWWKLVIEGDYEPSDCDIEHISNVIKQGYIEGELLQEDENE